VIVDLPILEVVVPVLNEERALPINIPRICAFTADQLPNWQVRVQIADNGSTDRTPSVASELAERYEQVSVTRLEERGRGRALRSSWLASDADVLAYMDVDLSANLEALPELLARIEEGCDVAIGSRHAPDSEVVRSLPREMVSRGYNLMIKGMFGVGFSDAQCGFKAITSEAAQRLIPLVQDQGWFFDSELLILAEALGYRIGEVSLSWVEDTDSRVDILGTALADLRGLGRLRLGGLAEARRSGALRTALTP